MQSDLRDVLKFTLYRQTAMAITLGLLCVAAASAQITVDQVRSYVDRQQYRVLTFQEQITWNALYPEFGERMLPVSAIACEKPGETPADVLVLKICMQVEDTALYAFVPFTGSGYEKICTLDGQQLVATSSALAPDAPSAVHLSTRLKNYADTLTQYHQLRLKTSKNRAGPNLALGVFLTGLGIATLASGGTEIYPVSGLCIIGGPLICYKEVRGLRERRSDNIEIGRLEAKLSVGF